MFDFFPKMIFQGYMETKFLKLVRRNNSFVSWLNDFGGWVFNFGKKLAASWLRTVFKVSLCHYRWKSFINLFVLSAEWLRGHFKNHTDDTSGRNSWVQKANIYVYSRKLLQFFWIYSCLLFPFKHGLCLSTSVQPALASGGWALPALSLLVARFTPELHPSDGSAAPRLGVTSAFFHS